MISTPPNKVESESTLNNRLTHILGRNAFLLAVIFSVAAAPGLAENWPGWRGPTGRGYTTEENLPLTWDAKTGENVLWKVELHGGRKRNPEFSSPGWSSPIVWDDRVFLTTAIWPEGMPEAERRTATASRHRTQLGESAAIYSGG